MINLITYYLFLLLLNCQTRMSICLKYIWFVCLTQTSADLPKEKVISKTKKYLSIIGDHIEQVLCIVMHLLHRKELCYLLCLLVHNSRISAPPFMSSVAQVLAAHGRGSEYRADLWEYVAAYIKNPKFTGGKISAIYEKLKTQS